MQFLTGHRETQTELLRIFNALQADGRQIVMTSDRPPVGDRRRRRAADHAPVRRIDRRHGHARLRDAHGDPQGEVRGARRAFPRRRRRRGRAPRVQERARAAGRAQSTHRLPDAGWRAGRCRQRCSAILGDLAEQRPRASPPRRRRASFRASSRTSRVAVAQHVEQWKTRLTEAIAYWTSEGYRTGALDARAARRRRRRRVVETVLREFEATRVAGCAISRSRSSASTARSRAHDAFHDPDRVRGGGATARARAAHVVAASGAVGGIHARRASRSAASNQLAVRAADAIVARPGQPVQPAVHSRAERRREDAPAERHRQRADRRDRGGGRRSVACVPAQLFVDELIAALQEGTVDRWRTRYRDGDRAAARRRAVRRRQGANAGRAVPRLQRAVRRGQAARDRERPAAARARRARGAAAVALRGRARRADAGARSRAARAAVRAIPHGSRHRADERDARRISPSDRWRAFARSSAPRIGSSRRPRWRACR